MVEQKNKWEMQILSVKIKKETHDKFYRVPRVII